MALFYEVNISRKAYKINDLGLDIIGRRYRMIAGGRALIHSEPYEKDDAYEYIRRVYDNLGRSVIDCYNSEHEK